MLIAMSLYAFKFAAKELKREKSVIMQKAIDYNFLRSIIGSAYFYVIEKYDKFKVKERPDMYYLFDGRKDELYFVTSSPLKAKTIALAHIFVKDEGIYYEESPVYDFEQNFKNPVILEGSLRKELFGDVEDVKLSYIKSDGKKVSKIYGDMPRGVELEFRVKDKKFKYYFALNSNFYDHKKYLYNEKYPF